MAAKTKEWSFWQSNITILGLKRLNLSECYHLSDDAFIYFSRLVNLEELSLQRCYLSDNGLANMSKSFQKANFSFVFTM